MFATTRVKASDDAVAAPESADAVNWTCLPGTICCGHPNRHVLRTSLVAAAGPVEVFIKKEHRRRFQDRLKNFLAGFGWCSTSLREYRALVRACEVGVGCPQPIAAGDSPDGRSYLVIKKIANAAPLVDAMRDTRRHRQIADLLGKELARLHGCGFVHGDLYAKHILIDNEGQRAYFLDWQRAYFRRRLSLAERCADLAALHATIHETMASPRIRLRCLIRYLQASRQMCPAAPPLRRFAAEIDRRARRLLKRSRIRRLRAQSLSSEGFSGELIWIDGERLAITPECFAELDGRIPDGLRAVYSIDRSDRQRFAAVADAVLVRHRPKGVADRIWAWIRRRPFMAREIEQTRILQHLRRHGIGTPKLLAVGQRRRFMTVDGFALWREPPRCSTIEHTLHLWDRTAAPESNARRKRLVACLAEALRCLHSGGYRLHEVDVLINDGDRQDWNLCLVPVASRPPRRRIAASAIIGDLERLGYRLALSSRRECAELMRAYFGAAADRAIVRRAWRRLVAILKADGRSTK